MEKGSAAKRHRQSLKRRMRNRTAKSEVRTTIKSFTDAVGSKDKDEAAKAYNLLLKKWIQLLAKVFIIKILSQERNPDLQKCSTDSALNKL